MTADGRIMVPIDILTVDVQFEMSALNKEIVAVAIVEFETHAAGFPYFDLKPPVKSFVIDGNDQPPSVIVSMTDRDQLSQFKALNSPLEPGRHTMQMRYEISQSKYCAFLDSSSIDCFFFMYDLTERTFFEQYAPTNFEFDRYQMTVTIKLDVDATTHHVLSNGEVAVEGNTFRVFFPDYYNTSCFFLHILPVRLYQFSRGRSYANNHEVVVYSRNGADLQHVYALAQESISEMSRVFGPSRHKRFLILVDDSFPGGMEFAGGAITSTYAVPHEISHSWFARGTLPANGNAGWIDEGIATWRDQNYPSYSSGFTSSVGGLGAASPFRRMTPQNAYADGLTFFARLDYELRDTGGLLPILRKFYSEYFGRPITSERFLQFVNSSTGRDFSYLFREFVF